MERVLIVDDEIAARETLRYLVDWRKIGFEEPMMACDGREALKLCQEHSFAYIFTDIEMPVMDGISFIREVRNIFVNQEIVIISCHESFQYAREAMKLGVSNYLIKDLINEEELYAILLRKRKTADVKRVGNVPEGDIIGDILVKIISDELLSEWERECLAKTMTNIYGHGSCFVFVLGVDDTADEKSKYQLLRKTDALEGHMKEEGRFVQRVDSKTLLLLAVYPQCVSTAETMSNTMRDLREIRDIAHSYNICSLTLGVSEQFDDMEQVEEHYSQALNACRMKIFRGNNKTIFYNSLEHNTLGLKSEKLEVYLQQIEDRIKKQDQEYTKILKKIYRPNIYGGFVENNYLSYVNWRIWNMLFLMRKNLQGKEAPTLQILEQGVEKLNELENAIAMEAFLEDIISRCFISQVLPEKSGGVVSDAVCYVQDHIYQNLSLTDVADALHVHKGYLCRIFKEKMGVNLSNYITELKIKEAQNLLSSTECKTYEIAEKLGYQSPQYFSMVFKKQTNMSPNDYRKCANQQS